MTTLTDQDFPTFILESSRPVLVDFWATWCGPCRALTPVIDTLEREWDGKIIVARLDVDDNVVTARKYGIVSIPTLMLFKGGRSLERITGLATKAEIQKRVKNALLD